jgi:hypothetical protein
MNIWQPGEKLRIVTVAMRKSEPISCSSVLGRGGGGLTVRMHTGQ